LNENFGGPPNQPVVTKLPPPGSASPGRITADSEPPLEMNRSMLRKMRGAPDDSG
jgi:hypothetical protein